MGRASQVFGVPPVGCVSGEVLVIVGLDNSGGAVVFFSSGAFLAIPEAAQAGVALGPDADAISNSNITFGLRANPGGNTNDFMANDTWVIGRSLKNYEVLMVLYQRRTSYQEVTYPAAPQCV